MGFRVTISTKQTASSSRSRLGRSWCVLQPTTGCVLQRGPSARLEVLEVPNKGGHWNLSCRKALFFFKHQIQGPRGAALATSHQKRTISPFSKRSMFTSSSLRPWMGDATGDIDLFENGDMVLFWWLVVVLRVQRCEAHPQV